MAKQRAEGDREIRAQEVAGLQQGALTGYCSSHMGETQSSSKRVNWMLLLNTVFKREETCNFPQYLVSLCEELILSFCV